MIAAPVLIMSAGLDNSYIFNPVMWLPDQQPPPPAWMTSVYFVWLTAVWLLVLLRRARPRVPMVALPALLLFHLIVLPTTYASFAVTAFTMFHLGHHAPRKWRKPAWLAVIAGTVLALWFKGESLLVVPEAAIIIAPIALLVLGFFWLLGVNYRRRDEELASLRDRAERAAIAERTRIAREMHDIVSHSLAVVVALAEGAHATDDLARAKQANRAIADTARESLAQMRVMLGVLRTGSDAASDSPGAAPMTTAGARNSEDGPRNGELRRDPPNLGASSESQSDAAPYSLPLAPLLTQTPADVVARARDAGLPVTLTVSGTPGGSDRARLAVLRIVQEGLTNALRYAHDPGRVHVTIEYAGARVHVRIENDGVRAGETSRGAGLGIRGLQERVSALDGTVQAGPFGEASWRLEAEFDSEERND